MGVSFARTPPRRGITGAKTSSPQRRRRRKRRQCLRPRHCGEWSNARKMPRMPFAPAGRRLRKTSALRSYRAAENRPARGLLDRMFERLLHAIHARSFLYLSLNILRGLPTGLFFCFEHSFLYEQSVSTLKNSERVIPQKLAMRTMVSRRIYLLFPDSSF